MKRRPSSTTSVIAAHRVPRRRAPRMRGRLPSAVHGAYIADGPQTGGATTPPMVITAAAQLIQSPKIKRTPGGQQQFARQEWQERSWELRGDVGEFRFAGDRPARAAGQCTLFLARMTDDGPERVPAKEAPPELVAALAPLLGSRVVQQQFLTRAVQHLQFAGESLFVLSDTEARAYSSSEVTGQPGAYKLNDGLNRRDVTADEVVVRCWKPDPQWSGLPDSNTRAILPNASILRELSKHTSAQVDSRLAGAGLLLVASEIESLRGQRAKPEDTDGDGIDESVDDDVDPFVEDLIQTMTIPIQDRDSASAVVPLVAKVPGEYVDKVKHITFSTPLDPMAKDLRDEEIRRIALGMDAAPEVLLGAAGANHWNLWWVSEQEATLSVAPNVATVSHGLTVGWVTPIAEQLQLEDADKYLIWYEMSNLKLRPDRSSDAFKLYDLDEVSGAVLRRETGFGDKDAPDAEELKRKTIARLVQPAVSNPDLLQRLLEELGVSVNLSGVDPAGEEEPDPDNDSSGDDPLPERPVNAIPEEPTRDDEPDPEAGAWD